MCVRDFAGEHRDGLLGQQVLNEYEKAIEHARLSEMMGHYSH